MAVHILGFSSIYSASSPGEFQMQGKGGMLELETESNYSWWWCLIAISLTLETCISADEKETGQQEPARPGCHFLFG